MKDKIAPCGYRCNLCLAYRENNKGSDDQIRFSDGLRIYYDYYLPIEQCYCDGCLAKDGDGIQKLDPDCKIRACVIEKGLKNCAYCNEYPCEMLKAKFVFREDVEKSFGGSIPEKDYETFIKPYEGKEILDAIHTKVKNRKIPKKRGRKKKKP